MQDNHILLPKNLLPHKPPMVLISNVLNYSIEDKFLVANVLINKSDVFFDTTINGVPSYIGLEYMAQSIGCFSGIYDLSSPRKKDPRIGFIMGTRNFKNFINVFSLNRSYTIEVKEILFEEEIASFECKIFDDEEKLCQEAILNAYRPLNLNKFLTSMEN